MGKQIIYLIRHAEPLIDGNTQCCLGLSDVPLTSYGEREARKLRDWFKNKGIRIIYTSPLKRCIQTAEIIADKKMQVILLDNLHEVDVGLWENMTFTEIRDRYPKEYEARGNDLGYYAIPGGESFYQAGNRFSKGMEMIFNRHEDAIVVGHGGVNRSFICMQKGMSLNRVMDIPQPYAGLSKMELSGGKLKFKRIGYKPPDFLDSMEIEHLVEQYGTPLQTRKHMQATSVFLEQLLDLLGLENETYRNILLQAAKVHDLARTKKEHAVEGGKALRKAGYPEVAGLVKTHHRLPDGEWNTLSPRTLLFYADKRVLETQVVSLEERFCASKEKCKTEEAVWKHRQLYEQSLEIEKKIKEKTGGILS